MDTTAKTSANAPARKRERSPNFPAIGIAAALELVEKIYAEEKKSPMSPDLAARHLGYKNLNGASIPLVAALKRYGLLEAAGEDVKLTADAVAIMVYPKNAPERQKLVRAAARRPAIVQQLLAAFPDGLPSDENLKARLQIDHGFTEEAALTFIGVLREALQIEGSPGVDDAPDPGENGSSPSPEAIMETRAPAAPGPVQPQGRPLEAPRAPAGSTLVWELGGDVAVHLTFSAKPGAKQIRLLGKHVELLKMALDSDGDDGPQSDKGSG